MKRTVFAVLAVLLPVALWFAANARRRSEPAPVRTVEVFRGAMEIWSLYEGVLDARRMERVSAQIEGSAVLIELVPEGTPVRAGDLLARFDVSDAEADRVRLEHERTRIERELAGLRDAELPLERLELEAQVFEAAHALDAETRFLDAVRELAGRGLVDGEEVERQEARVAGLSGRLDQARTRLSLTTEHAHPARLARAEAARAAIEAQIARAGRRVEQGRVRAPADGIVVHLPLPFGSGFRTAHVGDTLHRNQAFLALPDMSDPVVHLRIPESDLPRVFPGAPVRIRPVAFPEAVFDGEVEHVGAMAQVFPGETGGRKGFPVRAVPGHPDARFPAGISVRVDVRSYAHEDAIQVPRPALVWRDGISEVRLVPERGSGRPVRHPVRLGWAGEETVEVVEGLLPGDRVEVP